MHKGTNGKRLLSTSKEGMQDVYPELKMISRITFMLQLGRELGD